MGRENGQIERLVQQDLQLVRRHALIVEFLQGMAEGTEPQRALLAGEPPALLVLEGLFGDVDETEINVEGADDASQFIGLQALDEPRQAGAQGGIFLLAQVGVPLAQGLDGGQHPGAGLLLQDFAQEVAEQTHPAAQFPVAGLVEYGDGFSGHASKQATTERGLIQVIAWRIIRSMAGFPSNAKPEQNVLRKSFQVAVCKGCIEKNNRISCRSGLAREQEKFTFNKFADKPAPTRKIPVFLR